MESDEVVEERGVVDIVAIHAEENLCVLGLVDLERWDDETQHNAALQARLNEYVAYWDSGQLLGDFPDARYLGIQITVFFRHQPDPAAVDWLAQTAANIQTLGIGFSYQLLQD